MKKISVLLSFLAFLSLSIGTAASAQENPNDFLQKALAKERVDGNLEEAIQLYKQVVQKFSSDRALAAKALVQIGKCYERLGKDEARSAYDRVLRDFGEQTQQVEEARARLAALGAGGKEPRPAPAPGERTSLIFRRIEFPDNEASNFSHLARLSPDGSKMLYVHYQSQKPNYSLYLMDVSTRQAKALVEGVSPGETIFFEWSPDGKFIVFTSDRSKTVDLWAIPMQKFKAAGAPLLLKHNLGKNTRLTDYTPGGVLTMFSFSQDRADLLVLPVDPQTGNAQGQFRSWARYPTNHFLPRWSPDGSRVAYTSRKGSIGFPRIFISSGNEKEDEEISPRGYFVNGVEWAGDGEYLLFPGWPGFEPGMRAGIFRISLKDGAIEPFYLGERVIPPGFKHALVNLQWLPKADAFFFEKLMDTNQIYTVDKDGKNIRLLSDKFKANVWTTPSPDGRYLAYQEAWVLKLWSLHENALIGMLATYPESRPVELPAWSPGSLLIAFKDRQQLKVFSVGDKTSRVLMEAGENSDIGQQWPGGFAWFPDGQSIAYLLQNNASSAKAHTEIWAVPVAGGLPRKIADAPENHPVLTSLAWHPNGKMIYVTGTAPAAQSRGCEHWAMENFLPKPKASK